MEIDLTKELTSLLSKYTSDVERELDEAKEEVVNEGVNELRVKSPIRKGKYAHGWRKKKQGSSYVVHNATDYQLTHLLEKGHAKRGGGRVAARPHIQPIEQKMISDYEKRVERAIKK